MPTHLRFFLLAVCCILCWNGSVQKDIHQVQISIDGNRIMCEFSSDIPLDVGKDLTVSTSLPCDLPTSPCGLLKNARCKQQLNECNLRFEECDEGNDTLLCYDFSPGFVGEVCCIAGIERHCENIPNESNSDPEKLLTISTTETDSKMKPIDGTILSVTNSILVVVSILTITFVILCIIIIYQWKCKTKNCNQICKQPIVRNKILIGKHDTKYNKIGKSPVGDKCNKNELPVAMGITVQSVFIEDTLYIGGGGVQFEEYKDVDIEFKLMKLQDEWTIIELPTDYLVKYFAMTSIKKDLVLVGGRSKENGQSTKQTLLYDTSKAEWVNELVDLELNEARESATATSLENHLIVVGGCTQTKRIASVEVLNMSDMEKMWKKVQPLPIPRSAMKSTVIKGYLYLMGGMDHDYKHPTRIVYKVNLKALVNSSEDSALKLWQPIRDVPYEHSTPINVKNELLAIGGRDSENNAIGTILLYKTWSRKEHKDIYTDPYDKENITAVRWVTIGHLEHPRYLCACSVGKDGKVIIAGGDIKPKPDDNVCFIKNIEYHNIEVPAIDEP